MYNMKHVFKRQLLTFCLVTAFTSLFAQKQDIIHPGEVWSDEAGNHIQAHGGGIIKIMVNNAQKILILNNYYLPFKK